MSCELNNLKWYTHKMLFYCTWNWDSMGYCEEIVCQGQFFWVPRGVGCLSSSTLCPALYPHWWDRVCRSLVQHRCMAKTIHVLQQHGGEHLPIFPLKWEKKNQQLQYIVQRNIILHEVRYIMISKNLWSAQPLPWTHPSHLQFYMYTRNGLQCPWTTFEALCSFYLAQPVK